MKCNFRIRDLFFVENIWNWCVEWVERIKDRRKEISEEFREEIIEFEFRIWSFVCWRWMFVF